MKHPTLILISVFFITSGFSQNWLSGVGGAGNDEALDITYDSQGNYIVSGFYSYGVDFNGTTLASAGEIDAFVSRTNPQGEIVWVKQFGGTGSDAAYANDIDINGNIFVSGYYSGTMTVDGTTLTSNNNSQDVFLAKLNPTGDLLWIRSFGGVDHDFVYDLALDGNGNAVITGNFKGTVTIGGDTYNSIVDPEENEPSYDIFVVKYDSNGSVLWSKHGQAIYDDRGTGLAINSNNEIALIGQFSDTLSFTDTYNNQVYNTGFVMLMDSDGDELWMKKMSASMCIPYDIVFHQDSLMYITGDFTGQLAIFSNPPVTTNSTFTKKIFLTKMNILGDVLWLENDGSESQFSSRAVDVDALGNAYVSGYFKCRLDEYSQEYGEGVFYSAGRRDVFVSKYSQEGIRVWERQFGGPGDDVSWDLTVQLNDEPIIVGAFSNYFHAPNGGNFLSTGWTPNGNLAPPNSGGLNYCSDNNYGAFATIESTGHQDILIAKPVDLSRQPYDFFSRQVGNNCLRDFLIPCINGSCLDTIQSCAAVGLMYTSQTGANGYIGPEYDFLWSTGSTSPSLENVSTGNYWLQVNRKDGCYSTTDSVTIIVHPTPLKPHISDDVVVNTESFSPDLIFLCYPDTVELTMGNVDTVNNDYGWGGIPGLTQSLDTVVNSTGLYEAWHVSPFGCSNSTAVSVLIDDWANQDTLDPYILVGTGPNDFLESDTLFVCQGESIHFLTIDSSNYQTQGFSMPYFSSNWSIDFPSIPSSMSHFDWYMNEDGDFDTWMMGNNFAANQSTWVIIDVELIDHCNGDTSTYLLHREFYLDVSDFSVQEFGQHRMCPGDTIEIGVNGGGFYSWVGPEFTGPDTLNTLLVTGEGTYEWASSILTPSGSFCTKTDTFRVQNLKAPDITMIPTHGIICPNDSVLMTAPAGTDYIWIGPNNAVVGSTQSIYASTQGFYFVQFINEDGCFLISNEVEVRGFNSPYIQAEPQQTICEGGTVTITVLANENSILDWPPPLLDNVFEQDVYEAGYYEVAVTFCGITDTVGINIIDVSPEVELSIAGFDTICAGEVLDVEGPQGYYSYQWNTGSQDTDIEVTESGIYFLTAENFEGCIGHSDTLHVEVLSAPEPPLLSDTTVCHLGSAVSYVVSTEDSVYWFNSIQDSLGIMGQVATDSVAQFTEYYGAHFNGECYSLYDTASVYLFSGSQPPIISGNGVLCLADSLLLTTAVSPTLSYSWLLPDSTIVYGDELSLVNPDSGLYVLTAEHPFCGLQSTEQTVSIIQSSSYSINLQLGDTLNCVGDSVVLIVASPYQSIEWNPNLSVLDSILVLQDAEIWASILDTNGCNLETDTIQLSFLEAPQTILLPTDTVCLGETTEITLNTPNILNIDNGTIVSPVSNPFESAALYSDTTYVLFFTNPLGCISEPMNWNIQVIQTPENLTILGDTLLCQGDQLTLITSPTGGGIITFIDLSSDTIGVANQNGQFIIPSLGENDIYESIFAVLNINGCFVQSAPLNIDVLPIPQAPSLVVIGNGCPDDTVLVYATDTIGFNHFWEGPNGFLSNNPLLTFDPIEVAEQGIYTLYVEQSICQSDTSSVNIQLAPQPQVSLFSDTLICFGDIIDLTTNEYFDDILWSTGEVSELISVADSGLYWVVVQNEFGCEASDSTFVETMICTVSVGNVFTPNNDGFNDSFKLSAEGLIEVNVKIYNRFGRLIYKWNTLDGEWDGTIQNNGFNAQEGTYYFVGNYLDFSGDAGVKKGYIQLLR